jgi:hypothetical protein
MNISNQKLQKVLTSEIIQYILLNDKNYFEIADEYTSLQGKFINKSLIEYAGLIFEMLITPLIIIVKSVLYGDYPSVFTLISSQKTFVLWKEWFRMKQLQTIIREWASITRAVNGPFISCNDAQYHTFIYADAMQRIYNLLSLVSKERAKRTK